ncbi:hypothetical protein GUITHDRAFT_142226 [Guillardia theta CCMP2712]|uniref:PDZ domain-containing protein n=1 Tax=Guillardia theta (strain CCMP2712) TaxID=905079 RepID=L1IY65_GUITC|nr:hypothetical protein GUITHDRAFT_142226 [Guillardia theta CCMP2712]EKX41052.1 hypothetical protein GUITHDRAFT_142226 [Guillardia theta CCMP2712]|eukprot:XP_005828032.1 hypothetical protein GUITHDRAFT_142226 [Guillardia theta CCMP2712]
MSRSIVGFGISLVESRGRAMVKSMRVGIALGDSIVAINGELISAGKEGIIQETTQRLLSGTPGKAFEITFEAFDRTRRNTTLLHVAEEIFPSSQRVEEQGLRVSTGIVLEGCDELKDVSWTVDRILPGSSAYFSQKIFKGDRIISIDDQSVLYLSTTVRDVSREDHLTRDEGERVVLRLMRLRNGLEREVIVELVCLRTVELEDVESVLNYRRMLEEQRAMIFVNSFTNSMQG